MTSQGSSSFSIVTFQLLMSRTSEANSIGFQILLVSRGQPLATPTKGVWREAGSRAYVPTSDSTWVTLEQGRRHRYGRYGHGRTSFLRRKNGVAGILTYERVASYIQSFHLEASAGQSRDHNLNYSSESRAIESHAPGSLQLLGIQTWLLMSFLSPLLTCSYASSLRPTQFRISPFIASVSAEGIRTACNISCRCVLF